MEEPGSESVKNTAENQHLCPLGIHVPLGTLMSQTTFTEMSALV